MVTAQIDGVDYDVGFQNRELLTGQLDPEFEDGFKQFLFDRITESPILSPKALIAEDKKKPLERLLSVLLQGLVLFYVSWTLFS